MFTGIVAAVGAITRVTQQAEAGGGVTIDIDAGALGLDDVRLGDSIAINGACMTVTSLRGDGFRVDVSRASLDCTCGLDRTGAVNLEKALRMGDSLGGHLVAGHVDGVGRVVHLEARAESCKLRVRAARALAPFISPKGSVTINGVSLTVNHIEDGADYSDFTINLIPHTLAATNLHTLVAGDPVNIEVDLIARQLARLAAFALASPASR